MNVAIFLDPVAILLVFGGAMLMAAMRSTRRDLARAVAALRPLLRVNVEAEAQAARVAVNRIAERTAQGGLATADRAPLVERFLARAAVKLSDSRDPGAFAAWGETELAMRAERHAAVHAVWRAAADAAPAMGMIGTVIGLIRMFSAMDDAAKIGPGMALALLTTLYGVIVANCIAGPVAARLERLSRAELLWQRDTLERLSTIARDELTGPLEGRVSRIEARLRAVA
ncbi:MotA/TolQ/ExbB proton channel family protein [uncultured Sphingomonas sp.]|uniref:MotA/TolQ/ExbB proton channel family protein n=1 Tax=uncultured Sphingomonas sp. TaxID=158754 RepID=UPI00262676CD|nr:MotA/TolQ/ExbB proton channel family protein [uncultured Sphingomonas sp.]